MKPDDYYRLPTCENCGAQDYRIDRWMNSRDTAASKCDCAGYVVMTHRAPWPHRIGSPYCWFRKDGTQRMPGDNDFKDYQMEQNEWHQTNSLIAA
jgi:hypothetical protein